MKKVSFRVRNFDKEQFLTYDIDNDAELDEDVLDFLEDEEPKGIVPIIFEEEEEFDTFSYDITDKIRLCELSNQEINAEMVLMVMRGLVISLLDMVEYRVPLSYLVLHRNYIYINSEYEVEFICIPLEEMQEEVDVNSFLRNFVACLRFDSSENGDYVARILSYINNSAIFNLRNMITLIESLMEDMGIEIPEDSSTDIYVDYQEVDETIDEDLKVDITMDETIVDSEEVIEEEEEIAEAEEVIEEEEVIVEPEEVIEEEEEVAEAEEVIEEEEVIVEPEEVIEEEEEVAEAEEVIEEEEEVAEAEEVIEGEEEIAEAEEVIEEEEEIAEAEEVIEEEEEIAEAEEVIEEEEEIAEAEEVIEEEEEIAEAEEVIEEEEEIAEAEEVIEEEEEIAEPEEVIEEEEEVAEAEEVIEEEEEVAEPEEVIEEEEEVAEAEEVIEEEEEIAEPEEVIEEEEEVVEPEEVIEEEEEIAEPEEVIEVIGKMGSMPKAMKQTSEVEASKDKVESITPKLKTKAIDTKETITLNNVSKEMKKPVLKTKDTMVKSVMIQDELDEFLAEKEMEEQERPVKHVETTLKIKKDVKVSRASVVKNNQEEAKVKEPVVEEKKIVEEVKEEEGSSSILTQALNATGILKGSTVPKVNPYLIRVNTEERIMIKKQTFKIGKAGMGVDYSVRGNGAVSRVHAIITNKEDVYYIKDNKSTNHTYVNGKALEDGEILELVDDCKIVLGDEEFIFKY